MAKVPDTDRAEATPLFDVNGGYVGYLAGPAFYAQAVGTAPQTPGGQMQMAQAVGSSAERRRDDDLALDRGRQPAGRRGATAGGMCLAQAGICEGAIAAVEREAGRRSRQHLRPRRR